MPAHAPDPAAHDGASAPYRAAPPASAHPLLEALPPAPRVASPGARRLLFVHGAAARFRLAVGLVLLLVGGVFAAPSGAGLAADVAISLAGQEGRGEVVSLGTTTTRARTSSIETTTVRFRFTVGGASYTAWSSAPSRALGPLPDGAPVSIEYLPFSPSYARVRGTTRSLHGTPDAVLLLAFPFVGALLVLGALRAKRRRVRAFERGVAVFGEYTFRGLDPSFRFNGKRPFAVKWRFVVQGKEYVGSLASFDVEAFSVVPVGVEAVVLHDPQDPRANTLWVPGS